MERSFRDRLCRAGDVVILYEKPSRFQHLCLVPGESLHTHHGRIDHNDIIGRPYGTKVGNSKTLHVLRITPEWWTLSLKHRTQVIYDTDISLIVLNCEMRNGSFVAEAGTGSGSLSTSIARAIAPKGRLFTFEFHQKRAEEAAKEFLQNGLSDVVTIGHRDVCADGFYPPEDWKGWPEDIGERRRVRDAFHVDSLFLDVPTPWKAMHHVVQVLKPKGVFCAFTPCVEQMQNVCESMQKHNFCDIRSLECVSKRYIVRNLDQEDWGLGEMEEITKEGEEQQEVKKRKVIGDRAERGSRVLSDMKGHTGYLTFGRFFGHLEEEKEEREEKGDKVE
eukprot:TRINITY_DN82345_c0_g1_i1.p1 TRINITY_DN82345_c0_g1~~TRINITY_DN82345_c0_g1_i1.p1  ORF type:complete len:333 (+),score=87.92 TRINITY_DN82345_c0_g1_i1:76-1074(+)